MFAVQLMWLELNGNQSEARKAIQGECMFSNLSIIMQGITIVD